MPRWTQTPAERFFGRIAPHPATGCWNWIGAKSNGYGFICMDGKMTTAHRFAYRMFVEEVADGLDVDHLCRNRACCNPEHLEAVTRQENLRRGIKPANFQSLKTHCRNGHPYDVKWSSGRACRACNNANQRARYWAKRQKS